MIPVLFKKNEQQFRTYGLGEITDIINPKVTRERNGQYLLYFQYPQNAELSDVFEEDMRIKSDAGVRTKWQTFEISRVIRKEGQLIEVFAKHISQSLLKDALNPSVIVRTSTAQQALNIWNNNRIGDENFDVWSDISTISSTSWNIRDVSNAFEALAGVQGSILDVWGGEYEFDNKMIRLHKEMGRKSPVPLEYGRNITGLEQDQQDDNVYTSVYPFATYIPESGSEPETVTLPERYVDGKYLEMHNKRKIQVVDFSGEYDIDNPPTVSSLRTIANHYLEANEVGLPHENLKVEYVDLSKTLDYQEFQTMEEVELNDRLPIFYPKFGITNENAKVVVINYDPVKEENISIELGVIGQSFRTVTTGGIGSRLDRIEQQQNETASYIVNAQGNRIWYTTPDENMEHKIGDTWFEENGQYTRIRVWNGSQWIIEIDTEDIDKNAKAIAEQQEDIEEVKQTADEAVNRINGEIAGKFTSLDTEISQVHQDAQTALNQAGEAVSQVAYFGETLDGFTQTVANIDGRVANIRHDVDGITQTVTDQTGRIANQQLTIDGLQTTVASKASQSEVTQLSNLVNTTVSDLDGLSTSVSQLSDSWVLGIKDGEDIVTAIHATPENILLQANKIQALGDVVVDGKLTITDEFIAPNAQIDGAKIADATIGSAKINSLDVNKISGNRTDFVQSWWNNGAGGGVSINGSGFEAEGENNGTIRINRGLVKIYDHLDNYKGNIGASYHLSGSTMYRGIAINMEYNNPFAIVRSSDSSNDINDRILYIPPLNDEIHLYGTLVFPATQSLYSNGKETFRFHENSTSVYKDLNMGSNEISNVNRLLFPDGTARIASSGSNLHMGVSTSYALRLGTYSGESFSLKMSVVSGGVRLESVLNANSQIINNLSRLEFGTGGRLAQSSNNLHIGANDELRLGRYSGDTFTPRMIITSGGARMAGTLNMDGNSIINSPSISDVRLKDIYGLRDENDLEKLMQIEYVNFRWKNEEHGGDDLGFVAQQVQNVVPEIMMETADGMLGYNGQSYLNFIGHAVQQLALRELNTNKVASQALQLAEDINDLAISNKSEIDLLKEENKELRNEIQKLKEAA